MGGSPNVSDFADILYQVAVYFWNTNRFINPEIFVVVCSGLVKSVEQNCSI